MKERIIQFLTDKGLSSTHFADKIGVQRSSISHILSGRNKPSFDFIEKMLKSYPDINAEWLILGKGPMLKSKDIPDFKNDDLFSSIKTPLNIDTKKTSEKTNRILIENETIDKESNYSVQDGIKEKVDRIVIFFNNGLFKEYHPSR